MPCPHCAAPLPPRPSALVRHGVVALAWTTSMSSVFGGILLGPAIIMVLPVLLPGGICTITAAHSWAYEDPCCEQCGKLVEIDGQPLRAEPAARALAQPA